MGAIYAAVFFFAAAFFAGDWASAGFLHPALPLRRVLELPTNVHGREAEGRTPNF